MSSMTISARKGKSTSDSAGPPVKRLKAIDWKGFSEKQIKAIKYTQKRFAPLSSTVLTLLKLAIPPRTFGGSGLNSDRDNSLAGIAAIDIVSVPFSTVYWIFDRRKKPSSMSVSGRIFAYNEL